MNFNTYSDDITKRWVDWKALEEMWEERVAILIYEANFDTFQAENFSAQAYGFLNKAHLKNYIQELKAKVNK